MKPMTINKNINKEILQAFREKFVKEHPISFKKGKVVWYWKTQDPEEVEDFLLQALQRKEEEVRKEIADMIHDRKVEWHKTCLTDQFVNGRFWEAQELWEKLSEGDKE